MGLLRGKKIVTTRVDRLKAFSRMLKKSASGVLASLRGSTLSRSYSEVGNAVGAFPFAEIYCMGERPTRSAVCTSSPLRSLLPCPRNGASWRAGVGRVRSLAFLSILRECSSLAPDAQIIEALLWRNGFPAAC